MSLANALKCLTKPTHIHITKSLGNMSFSIMQQPEMLETFKYMRQYTHYNFDSKYKNWFELNRPERDAFIDQYLTKHELIKENDSARNGVRRMDNENKDVNLMFYYLYENLKDQADEVKDQEVVFKDDIYDLLIEKE